ncbi:MAG TPA: hypothetical protein VK882_05360, partial [Nitrososphaeraceae archaeon]|nr:hypothetical protein [Nitrososphaeraceae archaeon]
MNRLNENIAIIIIFVLFILSIGSVMSTSSIPLTFAQQNTNSLDSNEKLNYTHYKTMINGFNMHYIIG